MDLLSQEILPEDYDGQYRGEYSIEDTRQSLFEARQKGIHLYCITIDKEAGDYLPHMYGAANYVLIEDIYKLPLKVSDIYRKLTAKLISRSPIDRFNLLCLND